MARKEVLIAFRTCPTKRHRAKVRALDKHLSMQEFMNRILDNELNQYQQEPNHEHSDHEPVRQQGEQQG